MRINASLGSKKWEFIIPSQNNLEYDIRFEICDVSQVIEHEQVLPDSRILKNLVQSIEDNGFIHPILRFLISEFHEKRIRLFLKKSAILFRKNLAPIERFLIPGLPIDNGISGVSA